MAKKKAAEPEVQEIDYNEIHETPIEAIVGESTEQKEEVKTEEPIKEEVKELVKETPKEDVTYEEVPFDAEEYKKQLKEEILKEIAPKPETKQEVKESEDADTDYTKFVKEYEEKNGHPPTYAEALNLVEKKAIERLEAKQIKHQKEIEDQNKVVEDQNKQQVDGFNKYTNDLLEDLRSQNKIPKIVNAKDMNDPGFVVQKALFQTMLDVNTERQKSGLPPVMSIKDIFYEHYKAPTPKSEDVAGADAPVSPSHAPVSEEPREIDYLKDIQPGRNFTNWLTDAFRKKS
jgi:hypothetical protein